MTHTPQAPSRGDCGDMWGYVGTDRGNPQHKVNRLFSDHFPYAMLCSYENQIIRHDTALYFYRVTV
jgi:hypothetical protein